MMGYLGKHRLLSLKRSSFWQKSRILNIVIVILLAYLALNFIALGFLVDRILVDQFPDVDPVVKFTEYFFYYLLLDLLIRFLMQEMPVVSIAPYLHLPIKRSKIFNYLLTKSLLSFLNYMPLLIVIPFYLKAVVPAFPIAGHLAWILSILVLIFFNNYITFTIKKIFTIRPAISLAILVLIALVIYLDQSGRTHISSFFAEAFMSIPYGPYLITIPLLLLAAAYALAYLVLEKNAYIEDRTKSSGSMIGSGVFSSLGEKGTLNSMMLLEIRLILRNARPRTMFIMAAFLLLYGLIFYGGMEDLPEGFYIFVGVFVTGSFMINLGQLVYSWNSMHFDLLLVQQLSINDYIRSKYRFYVIMTVISYFLTIPYALFGVKILYVNTAVALFNIGVNAFIILWMNTSSTKRVDLGKGAFFNYEGFGASQFLLALPVLLLPIVVYAPFGLLGYSTAGFVAVGVMGLCGIIFRNPILNSISKKMTARKYVMAAGFRRK